MKQEKMCNLPADGRVDAGDGVDGATRAGAGAWAGAAGARGAATRATAPAAGSRGPTRRPRSARPPPQLRRAPDRAPP